VIKKAMEDLFKQKLLRLRDSSYPKTFSEALLGDTSWLKKLSSPIQSTSSESQFTEKIQVIESLERFANEKASEINSNKIQIEGGEILVRTGDWENIQSHKTVTALLDNLLLDQRLKDISLKGKQSGQIKILFVSEKFRSWEEVSRELSIGFLNELIAGFPLKTAELFERMIQAMKLKPSEVLIYPVEGVDEVDFSQDVLQVISYFNPELVVTLGAKATQKILKSNDRLSQVHGQFFTRKYNDSHSFQIVPLFHPSIIETNQNMKKAAWADMQKIMKFLKIIP
jgi:uracil-DNA glycosylase family 4